MRRLSKVLRVLPLLTILAPGAALAQSIGGQVVDEATGSPVTGVTVTLLDSAGVVAGQQTTGDDGRFTLAAPGPGKYRLRFQVPGYRLLVTPLLELLAGEEVDYPLTLRAIAPALLDTLLVEGRPIPWNLVGFYHRRKVGQGYFATEEEWERWAVWDISDVVRRLNPFAFRGGGGCVGAIFVDGMPMPSDSVNDWSLDNLAAIEVYRVPFVPPEFDRPFGVCGATVLWTGLDGAGHTTHLDVGAHAGTAMAGAEGGRGRVGVQAGIGLAGPIELYTAFSSIVSALDPGSVAPRSGWELIGALRVRPLGRETGWFVGVGGRAGGLSETQSARSTEEQHLVVLSGLELPVGRIRPYFELQVLGPQSPGSTMMTGFVGVSARIY